MDETKLEEDQGLWVGPLWRLSQLSPCQHLEGLPSITFLNLPLLVIVRACRRTWLVVREHRSVSLEPSDSSLTGGPLSCTVFQKALSP